jgi:inosine-uridine nucleoside N-ribohydrolase
MPQRRRVIINTDAKNEADDQFAIVHGLLSPSLDIRGVIPAHFGTRRSERSMEESREEVDLLVKLLRMEGQVPVANGAAVPLADESTPRDSPGARLIITQAMASTADDPLFVSFLGPLTDMASAILLEPEIVNRNVTVIWIGGREHGTGGYQTTVEFNLSNDIAAANVVFDSGIDLWQVPSSVYSMCSVGYAELEERIGGCGELGRYLITQLVDWNARHHNDHI